MIRNFYLNLCSLFAVIMLISILILSLPFLILIQSLYGISYHNWEAVKPYALIKYSMQRSLDYDLYSEENILSFRKVYIDFNRSGSIYADFSEYASLSSDNQNPELPSYASIAFVNNNYLRQHPVLDLQQQPVAIAEDEEDFVLLVPEKYKDNKQEILNWHKKNLQQDQKLRIIWLEDNQSSFTYRLDIKPEAGNCVREPVLAVVSECNLPNSVYSNLASSALFIPVANTELPSPEVNQVMGKYFDSSQVSFACFGVYSLVSAKIQAEKRTVLLLGILLITLFSIFCSVILQTVRNYFEQHKQRLAVQHFMGFKLIDKYRRLLNITLLTYPIVYYASARILNNWQVISFALLALVLELFVVLIFVIRNERKNILQVIKGG